MLKYSSFKDIFVQVFFSSQFEAFMLVAGAIQAIIYNLLRADYKKTVH